MYAWIIRIFTAWVAAVLGVYLAACYGFLAGVECWAWPVTKYVFKLD
jgi:hypothetical protein